MDLALEPDNTDGPSAVGVDTPMESNNDVAAAEQSGREVVATSQGIRNGKGVSLGRESSSESGSPMTQSQLAEIPLAGMDRVHAALIDATPARVDETRTATSTNVLTIDETPVVSSRSPPLQTNVAPSAVPIHAPREHQTKLFPVLGDSPPPSADEAPDAAKEHAMSSRIDEADEAYPSGGEAPGPVQEHAPLSREVVSSSANAPVQQASGKDATPFCTDEAFADATSLIAKEPQPRTDDAPALAVASDQTPQLRSGKSTFAKGCAGYTPPPSIPLATTANILVNPKSFLPSMLVRPYSPYSGSASLNPVHRAPRLTSIMETSALDAFHSTDILLRSLATVFPATLLTI
ncbi:hypothetical protein HDU96_010330 [Phlyctochytrium bullatum]|nr:hypothetical protein HDU96_010330 [Phlyctochytrium bullatum]